MISEFWTSDEIVGWSTQVGNHGDYFQRRTLKPFILSCLSADPRDPEGFPVIFPRMHRLALDASTADTESPAFWTKSVKELSGRSLDLTDSLVIDLGCGEGCMLRFLSDFGATGVAIDGSPQLINFAKKKWGERKAKASFVLQDLSDSNFDLLKIINSQIEQRQICDFREIIVLCLNVLDHIKDITPIIEQINLLVKGSQKPPTVIVSTLNPHFFFKYGPLRQGKGFDISSNPRAQYTFPWSETPTEFFPRDWVAYDTIFTEANIDVTATFATDLDAMGKFEGDSIELRIKLDLPVGKNWKKAQGPFNLWRLQSPHNHTTPTKKELETLISKLPHLAHLSPKIKAYLKTMHTELKVIECEEGEIIASPGQRCPGVSFVSSGSFDVKAGAGNAQHLRNGLTFGDLECSGTFYAGRYLYEVRAGPDKGALLMIPTRILNKIFSGLNEPASCSLGDILFLSMRKSFNTFTPYYHRSSEVAIRKHRHHLVKNNPHLNRRTLSARDIEHFVRGLVTLINIDEEKFKIASGFPNLSFLINAREMRRWISGNSSSGSSDTPYQNVIAFLHDLGIIDSFSIRSLMGSEKSNMRNEFGNLCSKIFREGVDTIIRNRLYKDEGIQLTREQLERIVNGGQLHKIDLLHEDRIKSLVKTDKDVMYVRRSLRALISESQKELRGIVSNPEIADNAVLTYYYNIAFIHWSVINAKEKCFLVIRDYPFLRRVTGGGEGWLVELAARTELYGHVLDERHRRIDEEVTSKEPAFRLERARDYIGHFKSYVLGHWNSGIDVDYSGAHRVGDVASWWSHVRDDK